MTLVPAVTELILAELLYLQYENAEKPITMYINSTGTSKVCALRRNLAVGSAAGASRRPMTGVVPRLPLLRKPVPHHRIYVPFGPKNISNAGPTSVSTT
jgi:hypothetical protein